VAFWQRKSGKVKVLVYDPQTKKQGMLPRAMTQHLDDLPEDMRRASIYWLAHYTSLSLPASVTMRAKIVVNVLDCTVSLGISLAHIKDAGARSKSW
jgi:hypothetical protein